MNGDNANDGRSQSTPKRTIAGLGALSAGMRIGLARGSSWREQLGSSTPVNNVTVGAYGTGAKPILRADDVVTGWTKTGGLTNVYEATWTPLEQAGKNTPCVYQDGVILTRVASQAACDSTPGSFYASSVYVLNVASPIYIHATGSGDPTTNGKTYEIPRRFWALRLGADCIVRNVRTKRSLCNNGSAEFGRRALAEDCIWEDGHVHNALMASGEQRRCYAWKADPYLSSWSASAGIMFIHYDEGTGAGTVTYEDCVALMPNVVGHTIGGYFGHGQSSNPHSLVTYDGCIAAYCQFGFDSAQADATVAIDCLAYECGLGYYYRDGEVPMTLSRCEYYCTNASGFSYVFAAGQQTTDVTSSISIADCVFVTPAEGLRFGGGFNVSMVRSIIAGQSDENNHYAIMRPGADTSAISLTLTSNLFERWGTAARRDMMNIDAGGTTTITGSNNVYATNGGSAGNFRYNALTHTTPTDYLAAVQPGNEVGSTHAAVTQLANAVSTRNYALAGGSAAASQGVGPVGFTPLAFDYAALTAQLEAA